MELRMGQETWIPASFNNFQKGKESHETSSREETQNPI
jgi:hypothetical protein